MTKPILILLLLSGMADVSAADLEWPKALVASDRRDVLALATEMGIADPAKVVFEPSLLFGGPSVYVDSRPVETEDERRWSRASMFRDTSRESADVPAASRPLRVGRWVAQGQVSEHRQWRVRDRGWTVDVGISVEDPVEYEVARQIVLAIRQKTLINAQEMDTTAGVASRPAMTGLDAARIYWIEKAGRFTNLPKHVDSLIGVYSLTLSSEKYSGLRIVVRTVPAGVELLGVEAFVV
jgi:hypothetical protein